MNLAQFNNSDFDRGASVVTEAVWTLVKIVFFLNPLPFPSSFKASLLRLFGAKVGTGVVIRPRVNITFPWRLSIGDHAWIGEEVLILSLADVSIGAHVCLSQRAFLCAGSHDFKKPGFDLVTRPIVIEPECWVAAAAFVGPGVTIGSGSVVSANSVVMNDVPPQSLARGNPAEMEKIVREG